MIGFASPSGKYKVQVEQSGAWLELGTRVVLRGSGPDTIVGEFKGDAAATKPSGWNRYAHVTGDPVNYIDRRGLDQEGPPTWSLWDWLNEMSTMAIYQPGDPYLTPPVDEDADLISRSVNSGNNSGPFRLAYSALAFQEGCAGALGYANSWAGREGLVATPIVAAPLFLNIEFQSGGDAYSFKTTYDVAYATGGTIYVNNQFSSLTNLPVGTLAKGTVVTTNLLQSFEQQYGLSEGSVTGEIFWAIHLLHELGHVKGTKMPNDQRGSSSEANTRTIIQNCFRGLLR